LRLESSVHLQCRLYVFAVNLLTDRSLRKSVGPDIAAPVPEFVGLRLQLRHVEPPPEQKKTSDNNTRVPVSPFVPLRHVILKQEDPNSVFSPTAKEVPEFIRLASEMEKRRKHSFCDA